MNSAADLTAAEAVAALRRLVDLDGAFFPCLEQCEHLACEMGTRVLNILERVR